MRRVTSGAHQLAPPAVARFSDIRVSRRSRRLFDRFGLAEYQRDQRYALVDDLTTSMVWLSRAGRLDAAAPVGFSDKWVPWISVDTPASQTAAPLCGNIAGVPIATPDRPGISLNYSSELVVMESLLRC
jgi:hypothetical protein